MIGEASTTSEVCPFGPPSPASTGQQRCCRQRSAASRASSGGAITETNRAWSVDSSRCAPISDARSDASFSVTGSAVFLTASSRRSRPPSSWASSDTSARSGQRRRTSRPPGIGPPAGDRLDGLTAGDLDGQLAAVAQLLDAEGAQLALDLDGLVPAAPHRAAGQQLGNAPIAAAGLLPLGHPPLQLEKPQVHGHRRRTGLALLGHAEPQQALHREVGLLTHAGGGRSRRAEHAELPPHLVLGRGGPVGIQQVALVEDGGGSEPGERERHRPLPFAAGCAPSASGSRAPASSAMTASSQLVSPCTCR